jgi:hypothetical protein
MPDQINTAKKIASHRYLVTGDGFAAEDGVEIVDGLIVLFALPG